MSANQQPGWDSMEIFQSFDDDGDTLLRWAAILDN